MCCAILQIRQGQIPGSLQSLLVEELVLALEAPGEDHLGAMVNNKLAGQSRFSIDLVVQAEHMHTCNRFQGAHESPNVEVLVVGLQEELGVRCSSVRIWRQGESSEGLKELCKAEEVLIQSEVRPVDSLHEALTSIFKHCDDQLPTRGFPLVGSVFFPSEGLVFRDVHEVRPVREPVHESSLEH
jgi:hypothetical protein